MMKTKPDILTPPNGQPLTAEKKTTIQLRGGALVGKNVSSFFGSGVCRRYREADKMYEIEIRLNNGTTMAVLYTQVVPQKIETEEDETDALNVAYEALEKMRRLNLEMQCFDRCGLTKINFECCTTCLLNKTINTNRFPKLQKIHEQTSEDRAKISAGFQRFVAATNTGATIAANTANANLSKLGTMLGQKPKAGNSSEQQPQQSEQQIPIFGKLWNKARIGNTGNNGTTRNQTPSTTPSTDTESLDQKPKATTDDRVLPGIQNLLDARLKSPPCLICASPSCKAHSSASFRKDGITLCLSCERLFELDFIVDCVSESDPILRAKHIDRMIDCYDRCLLLLKYSCRFIEPIAKSLEESQEKQNKIGLGSSGVGVLSGVLGIAAAASILTPAGPPLLIASLVFGGGATTVQMGNEAMNFFSEPNKFADRIIALHGMTLSILRVTSTLRDAMMRDHIRTDVFFEPDQEKLAEQLHKKFEEARNGVLVGATAGRGVALGGVALTEAGAVAGAEAGALAARAASVEAGAVAASSGAAAGARGATAMSRAAATMRFARFAGGALSAAVLVMEANAIQHTLKSIEEGNPCEKAKTMRKILEDMENKLLPSTSALDEECQAYLNVMLSRPEPLPEVPAEAASDEYACQFPEAECIAATLNDLELSEGGAVILEGDLGDNSAMAALSQNDEEESSTSRVASMMNGSSSLLERIQIHQQRQQQRQSQRTDEVFAVALESSTQGTSSQAELDLLS